MISSRGEAEALARTGRSSRRWRPFHIVLFVWGLLLAGFAQQVVGPKLVLTAHHGWERVWRGDGLSVVERRSVGTSPVRRGRHKRDSQWTLSNGDKIRVWRSVREMCWLAAWAAMMVVTVPLVWLLWQLLTKRLLATWMLAKRSGEGSG